MRFEVVRSDDDARMLTYIYYGPVSLPFGFGVRFPTIGLFVALTLLGWVAAVVLALIGPGAWGFLGLGVLASPAGAAYIARSIMRHIDGNRPLAYWREVIRHELSTPRPPLPIYRRKFAR